MSKLYLYNPGLQKLAKRLSGQETIHLGIRPYGFHAGNALSLLVYPLLLCRAVARRGIEPKFTIIYSLNDWEQDSIDSPDKVLYPFNVKPQKTTLQFTPSDERPGETIIDTWIPRLREILNQLLLYYPELNLRFIKNSWLKQEKLFQQMLLRTLKYPQEQARIFGKYAGKKVLPDPFYASPVCPRCFSAHNFSRIKLNGRLDSTCADCGLKLTGQPAAYDYWWYHKPLFIARMALFKVDLAISGGDHYHEGDYQTRLALARKFLPSLKMPEMLFGPVLLTPAGKRMSKSQHNARFGDISQLIKLAQQTKGARLRCPEKALLKNKKYEKYNFCF